MRFKDKLLVQALICLTLFSLIRISAFSDTGIIASVRENITGAVQKHHTVEDLKEKGRGILSDIAKAPDALVSVIARSGEAGEYGVPIDDESDEKLMTVYAVSGGVVSYAGIDKDLGICIRIDHGDKVSVYGNMCSLTAVTGERIARGDIIGTYDSECDEDFYYSLENK